MSPTSYQAAPPRVDKELHYRGPAAPESRNRRRPRTGGRRRGARAGTKPGGRGGPGVLKEEDDLAGADQAEILAGDRLDAVRVMPQVLDLGHQPVVVQPEGGDLPPEAGRGAPLPDPLDQPHVAEQRVEQERDGEEPEEDQERPAPEMSAVGAGGRSRGSGRRGHRAGLLPAPPRARTAPPGKRARPASSSSILRSRLYFATRSPRDGAPVLICPRFRATERSAMKVSSVSPERCDRTVA